MREIIFFILSILVLFFYSSCNCGCTQAGCNCPDLILTVEANVHNDKSGSFSKDELNNFILIRTSPDFQIIDTTKLTFGGVPNSDDYNTFVWINQNRFPNFQDFRDYNLLIYNTILNTTDTISSISYTEKIENTFCNECKYCEDEYVDCPHYYDYSLKYNSDSISGFRVRILNKE